MIRPGYFITAIVATATPKAAMSVSGREASVLRDVNAFPQFAQVGTSLARAFTVLTVAIALVVIAAS
jgi:hypothetical protein